MKNTLLYFEDQVANVDEIHRECLPAGWSLDVVTALQYQARRYAPSAPDGPPPRTPIEKRHTAADLDTHLNCLLRHYPIVIVDLGLPGTVCDCACCGQNLHGMHALRLALDNDLLSKVFVSSANVVNMRTIGGASWDLFEKCQKVGVTVFDKTRPADVQELKKKLRAWSLIENLDYLADFRTREDLYLAGTRGRRPMPEHVLITGPSGTGKDKAAWLIHEIGDADEFVVVSCGALAGRSLAQSALFGHVKGAYTDALSHRGGFLLSAIGWKPPEDEVKTTVNKPEIIEAIDKLSGHLTALEGRGRNVANPEIASGSRLEIAENAVREALQALRSYIQGEFRTVEQTLRNYAASALGVKREATADYARWLESGGHLTRAKNGRDLQVTPTAPTGTVVLDEFQDLSLDVQALLMRVMEQGEMEPLGFNGKVILVDENNCLHIRFIGVSNDPKVADLARTGVAQDARVRADLVARLSVWPVQMPPLSSKEVPILVRQEMSLRNENLEWEPTAVARLEAEADIEGRFPGHRRQMRQIILRAAAYADFERTSGLAFPANRVGVEHVDRALGPIVLQPVTTEVQMLSGTRGNQDPSGGDLAEHNPSKSEPIVTHDELVRVVASKVKGVVAAKGGVANGRVGGKERRWLTQSAYDHLNIEMKTWLADELRRWRPPQDVRDFMAHCVDLIVAKLDNEGEVYFLKGHLSNTRKKRDDLMAWLMKAAEANAWVARQTGQPRGRTSAK